MSLKDVHLNRCYKLWLESDDGKFILGEGTAHLLEAIREEGSLSGASRLLKISYAHAWRKIREIERNLGVPVIERSRGGKTGGSSVLTKDGLMLLKKYNQLKVAVERVLQENSKIE
jgi:molybdate transport system regulatory protein